MPTNNHYVFGANFSAQGDTCSYDNNQADCSGFVSGCLCRSGALATQGGKPERFTTDQMRDWFFPCWDKITDGKYQPGDVLVRKGSPGHTVFVCATNSNEPTSDLDSVEVCEAASSSTGVVRRTLAQTSMTNMADGRMAKNGTEDGQSVILRHSPTECWDSTPRKFANEAQLGSCSSEVPGPKN